MTFLTGSYVVETDMLSKGDVLEKLERTALFSMHEIFIDYVLLQCYLQSSGSGFREERARMSVDTSRSAVFVCKRLRIALFRTHMLVV